jgi:hypothetical protein
VWDFAFWKLEICKLSKCWAFHQTEISSHPQQPDGLGGPEPECHPRAWRNDKVLLDVYHERARNTGTQEGRQIRRYLGHYFTSKAGSVPWQDKMIL